MSEKIMKLSSSYKNNDGLEHIKEIVFENNNIEKINLQEMAFICHEKLKSIDVDTLYLYNNGNIVQLLTVVNYCQLKNIDLIIYHYSRDTNGYYPQAIVNGYDAGYSEGYIEGSDGCK